METHHSRESTSVERLMQLFRSTLAFAWPALLALLATLVIMVGLPMVLAAAN